MPRDRACGSESNNVIDLEISKIDPSRRFLLNLALFNYLTKKLCLSDIVSPGPPRRFPKFVILLPFSQQPVEASSTGESGKGKEGRGKKGATLLSGSGDRTIIGDAFSSTTSISHILGQMAPRWKGKDAKSKKEAEAEALKEPMSKIVSQLQSSLVQSNTCGFLSDNCVHLAVQAEQLDLLDKACFGQPVRIVDKDMYWFQLTEEEAFYLCYSLKCLKINGGAHTSPLNDEELWCCFKSKKETFPCFYKAYCHFRMKDWVVKSGAQYGVDFIVYRHHPARVHSEYGVLVLSHDNDGDLDGRLREWSDVHCTTRLLGSVAKTLLGLYVNKNGDSDESPLCLTNYTIEVRTISRWSPEQCRERSVLTKKLCLSDIVSPGPPRRFPKFVKPLPFSQQPVEASSTGESGKRKEAKGKKGATLLSGGGDRTIIGDAFSSTTSISHIPGQMAPRWKGKDAKSKKEAEAEALKEPMSKIVSQLQSSLVQSNTCGFLSDNCVHLAVQAEQLDLLNKACFGRPVRIVDKDMYWFQLTMEEAFYLSYSLKCLKINDGADTGPLNEELWRYFKPKKEAFPYFYKAYSHLRMKNWVVRSGSQYGVDFIVYRHHPARVHSEYGVLVLSHDNDGELNRRLRVWSDVLCTTRLLGSVAKTLLVLYVNKNGDSDKSLLCLTNYTIEERTISRRSLEQWRERSV